MNRIIEGIIIHECFLILIHIKYIKLQHTSKNIEIYIKDSKKIIMAKNHKNIYESIAILCGGISLILSRVPVVVCASGISNSLPSGRLVVARIVTA